MVKYALFINKEEQKEKYQIVSVNEYRNESLNNRLERSDE